MKIVEPIRDKKDLLKLEEIFNQQSKRNLLLYSLGVNLGLRISDILALNVGDVKNKDFIVIKERKTKKYKKIPLNHKIKDIIEKYTNNKDIKEPLFKTKFKNRMDRITAYRIIKTACKNCRIEANIGTHSLRKTFGYHFYKQFNDVAMLQKILNHSSPQITLRYIGIEQDEIERKYMEFVL